MLSKGESRETLENFWGNIYLRGQMIFDPTAAIADGAYGQPATGLPASRAFQPQLTESPSMLVSITLAESAMS